MDEDFEKHPGQCVGRFAFFGDDANLILCATLRFSPVLDVKGNAGSLDGLKIFSVPGYEW